MIQRSSLSYLISICTSAHLPHTGSYTLQRLPSRLFDGKTTYIEEKNETGLKKTEIQP